MVSAVELT
jgi:hypothetical protein